MTTTRSTTKVFLICMLFHLTGCATYTSMMKHPETGEVHRCSSHGQGLFLTAYASGQHDECVKAFEAEGFVRIDEPEETSKPSIKKEAAK